MLIIGLTGSIGMGKTTVAGMFRELDIPVHDSDSTVHTLYAGEAAPAIEAAFPGTTSYGAVDRNLLGSRVLANPAAIQRLENIVHPLVAKKRQAFLQQAAADGQKYVVLDIPLLFETHCENLADFIVVVSAVPEVQRARVLARPGMAEEKFDQILARQIPDAEKRARADFVIHTDASFDQTRQQVHQVLHECSKLEGTKYHA